jgi:hypothetical protein
MTFEAEIRPVVANRRSGLFTTLVANFVTIAPRLARLLRGPPRPARGSPELSEYLKRDIGMPPYDEPRTHWEIR